MYNMLTSQAKLIRDSKRSYKQKLHDEFVTQVDHLFYGPNYTEDSNVGWKLFKDLRKKNNLKETIKLMKEI